MPYYETVDPLQKRHETKRKPLSELAIDGACGIRPSRVVRVRLEPRARLGSAGLVPAHDDARRSPSHDDRRSRRRIRRGGSRDLQRGPALRSGPEGVIRERGEPPSRTALPRELSRAGGNGALRPRGGRNDPSGARFASPRRRRGNGSTGRGDDPGPRSLREFLRDRVGPALTATAHDSPSSRTRRFTAWRSPSIAKSTRGAATAPAVTTSAAPPNRGSTTERRPEARPRGRSRTRARHYA